MKSIKVLDVTLRDGGCVNNFNFGQIYMSKILAAQENSGVDVIELGYLDDHNGTLEGRTQWLTISSVTQALLREKKKGVTYVAMMDYGKFSPEHLEKRTKVTIDGIRLAFHKKNQKDMVGIAKDILDKGYQLYLQPMITLRYSDKELLRLIELVNNELAEASGFYIVDSFGEMHPNDMCRMVNLVEHNLVSDMLLGFHSHNNLQMAYSNACALLQFPTNRNLMIDSSIMGMGKGAGNLNTELLLEHLNLFYGKHYDTGPLLEVMDSVINQLHSEYYWGYAPEYYLSSTNHCSPTYASYFYNKHMLPIKQVGELLGLIEEEKKVSFDKAYAEQLYRSYNECKVIDDSSCIDDLKEAMYGKAILLIAPGKSLQGSYEVIAKYQAGKDVVTIGLNLTQTGLVDYLFITRRDLLESLNSVGKSIITSSNISKGVRGGVMIVDYGRWIEIGSETYDSSAVICLNILQHIGVRKVALVGFDGFSSNINENYADPIMRRPVTQEQSLNRNQFYKSFIGEKKKSGMDISFLTPSLYE